MRFLDFNFKFCTILLLVMLNNKVLYKKFFDSANMHGGGIIAPRSLKTKGNTFQARPKKFVLKS
jgi:hypothetical protein